MQSQYLPDVFLKAHNYQHYPPPKVHCIRLCFLKQSAGTEIFPARDPDTVLGSSFGKAAIAYAYSTCKYNIKYFHVTYDHNHPQSSQYHPLQNNFHIVPR